MVISMPGAVALSGAEIARGIVAAMTKAPRWILVLPRLGGWIAVGMVATAGCFPDRPAPRGSVSGGSGGAGGAGGGPGAAGASGSNVTPSQGLGTNCVQDDSCAGLACRYGFCRTTCRADTECPKGSLCLGTPDTGVCGLVGDGDRCAGAPCANGALGCGIDGRCRSACDNGVGCAIPGQQCIAGTCVGTLEDSFTSTWGSCSPEGASCSGDGGKAIVYCNVKAPGVVVGATCDSSALCLAGLSSSPAACKPSACLEGEYRCTGSPAANLERCNTSKTGYEPVATCAAVSLCEIGKGSGTCAPAKCGPSAVPPTESVRCVSGDVETCNGTAYVPTACNGKQCNPSIGACFVLDIDVTEVTRAAYAKFLGAPPVQTGVCATNDLQPDLICLGDQSVCKDSAGSCAEHPQVCVDWCDATAYCAAQGRTLCGQVVAKDQMVALGDFAKPGQSAWMNACSSGGELTWTHGNVWDQNTEGQFCNGAARAKGPNGQTLEVGQLGTCASPVAAYKATRDLGGNVAEWENSCAKLASSGDASLNDNCRVRGGSFSSELGGKTELRCDADAVRPRGTRSAFVGFRCCGK